VGCLIPGSWERADYVVQENIQICDTALTM
jgi:hypothetical protein